jgi:hypothetical protein
MWRARAAEITPDVWVCCAGECTARVLPHTDASGKIDFKELGQPKVDRALRADVR